ncbi:DUF4142 domain-containing protein [Pontibacter silvestris]|uniref:DUF4142 domain-containing protein n=1 Tax=Pontibacter silvestris TaxID=2305183 RepID=A0ABW4WXQ2_9BACT|nr:DUF4142 domain-containing protein [Pontibacter silvestris]MCC9136567.1 DUF4142 domain-containing protein [Pontibacter silvestris]
MKKIASTALVACAFLFGVASCNQQQGAVDEAQETNEQEFEDTSMEEQKASQSDFMTQAASSNMLEIQAGQLAQEKGQSQQVKGFGQMMVTDHEKATDQLKSLASQKSITLPDSMSQDHKDKLQSLRDKTGSDFDQSFMDLMVNSHQEAVNLFDNAASDLEDPDVKSFASSTLPTLRQHLDQANQIKDSMSNNSTASNQ